MSTLEACNILSLHPYKKICLWLETMRKQVPNYENNCQKGVDEFGKRFRERYEVSKVEIDAGFQS
jgi:hypothetical protein